MTIATNTAPELLVQAWFNTDRPLLLAGLRGRVVVLAAFQVLVPHFHHAWRSSGTEDL